MEMNQIRYFLAVADTLNFTRAAEQCHVAQPSLSKAIHKLEEELGGELFRRERSLTHLTALGREMHPLLRRTFDSALMAKQHATRLGLAERAPLRIGLSQTVRLELLSPALDVLSRAFPGLELHLVRGPAHSLLETLRDGEIDILIAAKLDSDWERLDHWPLFEDGFVIAVPPGWDAPSGLDDATVILRPYCETLVEHGSELPAVLARRQKIHEVSCDEDAAAIVQRGLGIAVMPVSSARLLMTATVGLEDLTLTREIGVYGVAGRQRPPASAELLKLLRAADWTAVGG